MPTANFPVSLCNLQQFMSATGSNACVGMKLGIAAFAFHSLFLFGLALGPSGLAQRLCCDKGF